MGIRFPLDPRAQNVVVHRLLLTNGPLNVIFEKFSRDSNINQRGWNEALGIFRLTPFRPLWQFDHRLNFTAYFAHGLSGFGLNVGPHPIRRDILSISTA